METNGDTYVSDTLKRQGLTSLVFESMHLNLKFQIVQLIFRLAQSYFLDVAICLHFTVIEMEKELYSKKTKKWKRKN